jgi:hypothetical protein
LADDHDNPYRMVLVTPGAADVTVYVDAEAFDEREQLIVAGPASVRPEPPIPEAPRSQRRPTPPPPRKP